MLMFLSVLLTCVAIGHSSVGDTVVFTVGEQLEELALSDSKRQTRGEVCCDIRL